MKTISNDLKTGIANGTIATFVKITRTDNTVFGYSDHDKEVTYDTVIYAPSPALQKISMNLRNNAEVSNQEFLATWNVDLDEDDLKNGLFDDANIDVFRADYTNTAAGTIIVFRGTLGIIQWTDEGFKADIHSLMRQLQRKIGLTYTAKCRHELFDQNSTTKVGACTLSNVGFDRSSQTTTVTSKLDFDVLSLGVVNGDLANGRLVWNTGLNTGVEYTVKTNTNVNIKLFLPTVFTIGVGDTFTVFFGCDKTFETCQTKFSNEVNFGGFPHIKPEVNWK